MGSSFDCVKAGVELIPIMRTTTANAVEGTRDCKDVWTVRDSS